MNGSRAARIRIEEILANAQSLPVELVGGLFELDVVGNLHAIAPNGPTQIGHVAETAFELRISIRQTVRSLEIPYEALVSAWQSSDGKIMVMLNVRAILTIFGTMTLIPFSA